MTDLDRRLVAPECHEPDPDPSKPVSVEAFIALACFAGAALIAFVAAFLN